MFIGTLGRCGSEEEGERGREREEEGGIRTAGEREERVGWIEGGDVLCK